MGPAQVENSVRWARRTAYHDKDAQRPAMDLVHIRTRRQRQWNAPIIL
jgi:hypothetical protein